MASLRRVRLVLREPLLHFLLLGFGLFLVYGWVGGPSNGEGGKIVITQGRIEQLSASFLRMNQRPPDPAALDDLIDDAIREEIYYREAKALGLDQDDSIVRRRMRQKLEFVSEDVMPVPEPTDAQLQAYLRQNSRRFELERRYSLTQVYLDPQQHGPHLATDTQRLLAELKRAGPAADASGRGDGFLLGRRFEAVSASELSEMFGARFEQALRTAPIGQWTGPVPSGYGVHLVVVRSREADRTATLNEVREDVRREWQHARRVEANNRFYADLRKRYVVTIEHQTPKVAGPTMVAGLQR